MTWLLGWMHSFVSHTRISLNVSPLWFDLLTPVFRVKVSLVCRRLRTKYTLHGLASCLDAQFCFLHMRFVKRITSLHKFSNASQTLCKRFANTSLESWLNQSARNSTRLAMINFQYLTQPLEMNCSFNKSSRLK